jgi:hypothetical protein
MFWLLYYSTDDDGSDECTDPIDKNQESGAIFVCGQGSKGSVGTFR